MSKSKLYVDSCCFIDAAKTSIGEKVQDARQKDVLFFKRILESARAQEIELYTSTLTVVECLHAGGVLNDDVKRTFSGLLGTGQYVRLVVPDFFVAKRSRDLRWVHEIVVKGRGADYLHLGSALKVGCREFVTTDRKSILSVASQLSTLGLRVVLPSQSMLLPDSRRQEPLFPSSVVPIRGRKKQTKR